jgi:pyruvate, water dikinase
MKIWKQISGIFKKPETAAALQSNKDAYLERYRSFRELLSHNNKALELMADMDEQLSGEFPPDGNILCRKITDITDKVRMVIDSLNLISGDKYTGLYDRFNEITSEMGECLTQKEAIPVSGYTAPFDEITVEMKHIFGNKNANLGEVRNRLKLPTPDGFAISAFAFKKFMDYNGLCGKINEKLSRARTENNEHPDRISGEIRELIINAGIPPDMEAEVTGAFAKLCERVSPDKKNIFVSVRSSATHEDGEFSFAGQYSTFLNAPWDSVLQKYKEVIASLYNPGGLIYYRTKNFPGSGPVMSVGVLEMIDALAAGVMYSRDPNGPRADTILVSSVRGLGKGVVDGITTPETYIVSRSSMEIIQRKIPEQKSMITLRAGGGVEEVPLTEDIKGGPCPTNEQIKTLAGYAMALENHYGYPQDVEWAIDRDERPFILQTRPLMILKEGSGTNVPVFRGYNVLLDKGIIASRGIGFGKAFIVRTEEDLKNFPEGAVLISKHTSTKLTAVVDKAAAIITNVGASTVHMATIAREFQVPAIVNTGTATEVIKNGLEITVDAFNCIVYEGHLDELAEFSKKRRIAFKETRLYATFDMLRKKIIPLNLVNPVNERFTTEHCKTLHDITRFAHQKAMHEMFDITKEFPEDIGALKLIAGIPLSIYMIDLGSGLSAGKEGSANIIRPEDVVSVPFNAFFRGLASVTWPDPRHIDAVGFMGMIAHTASMSEAELGRMGEKSFSFIAGEYMNFSINLGYHLSVVEAFTGENLNDNYIRFFFKGGAADMERRLRRMKLISEVLGKMDFDVKIREDIIHAVITKDAKPSLEEKLEILGKLTVYTKQLDAVMHDDSSAELHLEEFVRDYFPPSAVVP